MDSRLRGNDRLFTNGSNLKLRKIGDVAQMGERGVRNAEVRGSIPLISTRTS